MTYNLYLFAALTAGSGVGYFFLSPRMFEKHFLLHANSHTPSTNSDEKGSLIEGQDRQLETVNNIQPYQELGGSISADVHQEIYA